VAEDYKQDCGMSIFRLHVAISFFFESFKWQLVIRSHLDPSFRRYRDQMQSL